MAIDSQDSQGGIEIESGDDGVMDDRTERAIEQDIQLDSVRSVSGPLGDVKYLEARVINYDGSSSDGSPTGNIVQIYPGGWVEGTCPDARYNNPENGCKHSRYIRSLLALARAMDTDDTSATHIIGAMATGEDAFNTEELAMAKRLLDLLREME